MTTEPRPRTVDDFAAPYANHLSPVPTAGTGVCPICRSGCNGYSNCWQCGNSLPALRPGGADAVGIIALAAAREQLAHELLSYKREGTSAAVRQRLSIGIAAVLWKWLASHEACLARVAGTNSFSMITTVPSSNRQRLGEHPLVAVVSRIVEGTGDRYRPLLAAGSVPVGERDYTAKRFKVTEDVAGQSVLVIDDRWTSGAQLQSAAAALKLAGSGPVAALAIGRHYYPDDPNNAAVEQQRRDRRWSWDTCLADG